MNRRGTGPSVGDLFAPLPLGIGSLGFDHAELMNAVRLGVLAGSGLSAVLGYGALMLSLRGRAALQAKSVAA